MTNAEHKAWLASLQTGDLVSVAGNVYSVERDGTKLLIERREVSAGGMLTKASKHRNSTVVGKVECPAQETIDTWRASCIRAALQYKNWNEQSISNAQLLEIGKILGI